MHRTHRPAVPADAAASWAEGIRSGATPGHVCLQGEVPVLALLPAARTASTDCWAGSPPAG